MSSTFHLSRYVVLLAAVWIVAMTWRLYPQFKDTLREDDGHLVTLEAFVEDSCGQRIGPAVASCLAEARATARRLVAQEQAKSVLLVEVPLLAYLLVYAPARMALERWRRRGGAGMAGRAALE